MSEITDPTARPGRGHPSPMMFVSLGIGAAIALALIVVVSVLTGGSVKNATTPPPALVGTTLPAISESSLSGPTIAAPWTSHHPTVVVFFASWCGPCRHELPALAKYLAAHSLGKVSILGVDTQDTRASGQRVVTKDHLNFPVLFDPSSTVAAGKFQLAGLPDTVFVSAEGVVKNVHIGAISTAQFAAGVSALNA
ncbi:MAG: TlpA family protein disulfide reductase [Acidobacteria bacterium]|nr:TlpA family protein disulfide reductase [Acidobacteriota bacterium]